MVVTTVKEAREVKAKGKLAYALYFQNSKMILNDLSLLRVFHKLGVRIMQLTYNEQNTLGAGCCETWGSGLTYFGRDAVAEMNRLGVVVELPTATTRRHSTRYRLPRNPSQSRTPTRD